MRPLKSILVGIDFTPCSVAALSEATRLAGQHKAALRVIHVIDTQIALELEGALSPMQQDIRENLIADAHKEWLRFASPIAQFAQLPLEVTIEHRITGLNRAARECAADLLVLGAFGDQRPDVGAGTVATACVRHGSSDVLLVRDTHSGPYKLVVAAVDFSDTSGQALHRAVQIAAQDQSELHVIHVFDPPWNRLHYRAPTPQADPKFITQYIDMLQRRLHEFAQPMLAQAPGMKVLFQLSDGGKHRSDIAAYAESVQADLICLGTRGRSNVRDLLLGSSAEKVLLQSTCSVLAVKPDSLDGD